MKKATILLICAFLVLSHALTAQEEKLTVNSKFDFMPGEKVLYFDDFSQDNIGDFPARWNTTGSGEVITTNLYPGKWFALKPGAEFLAEDSIRFFENYTIEFDFIMGTDPDNSGNENFSFYLFRPDEGWKLGDHTSNHLHLNWFIGGVRVNCNKNDEDFFSSDQQSTDVFDKDKKYTKPVHFSIWIQKQRFRLYLDKVKMLDLPKLLPVGEVYKYLSFYTENSGQKECLITNLRIAVGAPDMRNKIMTLGKIISYGIVFDPGKDVVKEESYGTIKEIAQVLRDQPTLKIRIVGHTDNDGDGAMNLDLSKRRAASIKNILISVFGIEGSRLETDGKGLTEPIGDNATIMGKAQNRRVEFIKY
jgi:OmpA-OmpF porin, OOP family